MLTISQIIIAAKEVAKEFPIKKVTLFGSYANGTNNSESDVDLLVEFITESVSLITLVSIKYRFEELLGVDVDVIHAPLDENAMIVPEKEIEIYAA